MELAPTTTALDLWIEACGNGMKAGLDTTPTPMGVVRVDLDGTPIEAPTVIMEGPCGFAWVTIRPARGGFVQWLKARGVGSRGYNGGYTISTNDIERETNCNFGQSYERKMDAARAFANTLRAWGINATAEGRLD